MLRLTGLALVMVVCLSNTASAYPGDVLGITPGKIEFDTPVNDSIQASCLNLFKLYTHKEWRLERSSILEDFSKYAGRYSISASNDSLDDWQQTLGETRISVREKTTGNLYSWVTYPEGRFLISDSILYHTDYDVISSGMTIRAFDLNKNNALWSTDLTEIQVSHDRYRNWGADLYVSGNILIICGAEAAWPYLALLNRKNGKQLAHRIDSWK